MRRGGSQGKAVSYKGWQRPTEHLLPARWLPPALSHHRLQCTVSSDPGLRAQLAMLWGPLLWLPSCAMPKV